MTGGIHILDLHKFDVDEKNGFLSSELPLDHLENTYYKPWETLATNIPRLLLTNQLKPEVENRLPLLSIDQLTSLQELKRGYVLLTFIINGYVWSINPPNEIIPDSLALPLLEVSKKLGLPPVATYSSVVLWNYKLVDNTKEISLENLTTGLTFTGSFDEAWFYLISVYFEKIGAQCVEHGLKAIDAVTANDSVSFIESMKLLAMSIDNLTDILKRMDEKCDPYVFYFRIRPFLAGWKNMAKVGLPHGVKYGPNGEYQQWSGGSNAQSSLIQYLDLVLGVTHFSDGGQQQYPRKPITNESQFKRNSYLLDMRQYMPQPHRSFLKEVGEKTNIRQYVLKQSSESAERFAYDTCISMMKNFRDVHLGIIKNYILIPARAERMNETNVMRNGLATTHNNKNHVGTGGTSLVKFLTQCRDETSDMAVTKWVKEYLKDDNVEHSNLEMNFIFDYNYNFVGFKDKVSNIQLIEDEDENTDVDFFIHHW
ncbi:similar to Saccharomyces cerevisiae YJR078W BNA2 Putative tryptophan 2,3-dioxygenase or indoleamine 2,3-dioxygenase, required for de novo biosynthesis of NAD from tryptophan via kynurenine [Maudiozyma barnettii]|nr:similar to Saccharomyces cerevisiae YJR078W BNA2 Putative tryptophan 2,3-dioxygenase or indoleamine 2,3-dioxygenase, required for de novo biosynthesis of NAD from tryptophan via kynurenine [Kazachstania barnettii]